jgi:dipeptidyl aminopeptidase/acylaminoacyl peptidase
MPTKTLACFFLLLLIAFVTSAPAQESTYMKPPQAILDVLNAPEPPQVSVSPTRDVMLMSNQLRYPPIADVAAPMLRLAGSRIDPATNGPHRAQYSVALSLKNINDGAETKITLPANAKVSLPRWSPDGKRFAFMNTVGNGIELYVGDTASARIRRIGGVAINAAYGEPINWIDTQTLLVQLVPAGRGKPPAEPIVPKGPHIQESSGNAGPVRTYEDLLQTPHDELLWDYYASSQLAVVDVTGIGKITPIGKPHIFQSVSVAPDTKHLLVAALHRPYSYLLPAADFPRLIEVWNTSGQVVYKLEDAPLADKVPIGGVRTGRRNYQWDPNEPATLVWVEALDDGNPNKKAPYRDRIMTLKAPFNTPPSELHKTVHRFAGLVWLEKDRAALVSENDREKRWRTTFLLSLDKSAEPRQAWSLSTQERYNDPGSPVTRPTATGQRVAMQNGDWIFLSGNGSTPKGDLPFFDRFNLKTLKSERIFRCEPGNYETLVSMLNLDGSRFLTRHEAPADPPNYFVRTSSGGAPQMLTKFTDPTPLLRKVKKQLVTYKRADGVDLSFELYLPPDYKEGTRLPTFMWAYPYEYNDASTASQISGSPWRFTTITGPSELFLALQGYAVLDNVAMPVIGTPKQVNDTYVQQIVMDAKAAIEKAAAMGVTDPNRVGVGGHSYGGFMTANLLAHSDLFRAGIARSGAYNRTLTPFGFQSEERTLWEASETYLNMSPFMYADKLKTPLLLIHGEADDNSGTFPIQSERMYQAVRGNGGTVRLVMLPDEAHGYAARETIEHVLYEMVSWMERFAKDLPPNR